jgi:hypothetical protein
VAFTIGLLVGKKETKKKKSCSGCFYQTSLGRTYVEEPRKEEVEEKEEEGAYYARTILTKVSHRAPLGRPNHRACHFAGDARAHASRRLSYLYVRTT